MDANTYLASVFREEVPQIVMFKGIAWRHEPFGDWYVHMEYGE